MGWPDSADYVREKLTVAVDCLATGTSSIQFRLADAYFSALMRLETKDFPNGEAQAIFIRMRDRFSREEPVASMDGIEVTLGLMPDEEAVQWARDILRMEHLSRIDFDLEREG